LGSELHLSGSGQAELLQAFAEKGAALRTTVHGSSMFPFVRDGDVVVIAPVGARGVKVGDVVAFRHPVRGDLVIHRAVARSGRGWLMRGDACAGPDGVVDAGGVLGRVTAVERDGRPARFGTGSTGAWLAALSRRGWLGTGPGISTVPARGVRRVLRRLDGGRGGAPSPTAPTEDRPASRERLLLGLRRGDVDRSGLHGLSAIEWAEVLDLADRHGVTPALHRTLASAGEAIAIPPEIRERLRETTLSAGARNARALGHAGRLLKDLHAAGIEVAVLKGADLVERVYPDVSLRPMADVDLLVRPGDLRLASALLASKGYVPSAQPPGDEHQGAIDENLHVEPVQRPGGPLVELHYAIGVPARVGGLEMEGVWARMYRGRVGGAEALVLSPEDLLLHLCIHVALHHGFDAKLVQLLDLPAVVDRLGDRIDWDALDRRARDWGVQRGVAVTFALAGRLLGPLATPGKAPALDPGEGGPDPVSLAERLLFQIGRRGIGSANLPVLFGPGSWREKAGLVLRRVFPSREEMAFTYRVPAGSPRIVLLYPRRLLDLWRHHGGTVRALTGGDAAARRLLSLEKERTALVDWMNGAPGPVPSGTSSTGPRRPAP
jgi:hypothetical protein